MIRYYLYGFLLTNIVKVILLKEVGKIIDEHEEFMSEEHTQEEIDKTKDYYYELIQGMTDDLKYIIYEAMERGRQAALEDLERFFDEVENAINEFMNEFMKKFNKP